MFTIQLTEEQIASLQVRESQALYSKNKQKVASAEEAYNYVKHLGRLSKEHVVVITLNTRKQVIAKYDISVGTVDSALVHPREVFRQAVIDGASSVIVAHNHPSGDTEPSEDDCMVTKRLVTAGKILGITVVDHLIVGADGYCSLQESGRM